MGPPWLVISDKVALVPWSLDADPYPLGSRSRAFPKTPTRTPAANQVYLSNWPTKGGWNARQ